MIPLGYLYKKVSARPDWLAAAQVVDIYSTSTCISPAFADYIKFWKHNGYWFFNSPRDLEALAHDASLSLDGMTLFYYEAYDLQFDEERGWLPFEADEFDTQVVVPECTTLQGFDIATFAMGNLPECSPLSCNGVAQFVPTNAHCLLTTLDEALALVTSGAMEGTEPGPYRVIAVYTVGTSEG